MINEAYKQNLKTLETAVANKDVCLMECTDAKTGAKVITVCAMFQDDEGMFNFVPLAKMFDGNPYEELLPPQPMQSEGGVPT